MDIKPLYKDFIDCQKLSVDTRKACKDSIFFTLKGTNFDGNQFVSTALKAGAYRVVTENKKFVNHPLVYVVEDVLLQLQKLAQHHRMQMEAKIIAITGSNGKTTTKELLAGILAKKYAVHKSPENYNNEIGVPLTLLGIKKHHEWVVLEMGARRKGDITALCNIAMPDIGLITQIGLAHLLGFGGMENIIKTKGELYEYIDENRGIIFINGKDEILKKLSEPLQKAHKLYLGNKEGICMGNIVDNHNPCIQVEWTSKVDDRNYKVQTQLVGTYNLSNILYAISVAIHLAIDGRDILDAISAYQSHERSSLKVINRGRIFCDFYNANPGSMKLAIQDFLRWSKPDRRMLILGQMTDLGTHTKDLHAELMNFIKPFAGLSIIMIGTVYQNLTGTDRRYFSSNQKAIVFLRNQDIRDMDIFLKGSRSRKMEVLLPVLVKLMGGS